jgi:tungstate transport system permease protein
LPAFAPARYKKKVAANARIHWAGGLFASKTRWWAKWRVADPPRGPVGYSLPSFFAMNTFSSSAATAWSLITSVDPQLAGIVLRSLAVSALATAIACGLGLWLGAWLGVARFRGRGAVLALLNTALALPSVVVGLVVYLLLSRSGPLGFLGWLFSFKAMVLAQGVLVLPVVMALVRQAIEDADRSHGEQLQSLGARPLARALLLLWDERYALLTVVIAAFGRAVSEVGAVMIVGGNIDGFTRVMTTAIALETSKGDLPLALALGLVLLAVVLLLNIAISLVRRWRERRDDPVALGAVAASARGVLP